MTANALQKNVKKQLFRIGQMAKENFGSVSTVDTPIVPFCRRQNECIFVNFTAQIQELPNVAVICILINYQREFNHCDVV